MSCPTGFEPGPQTTCHFVCPADFRYTQEYGGEMCVLRADPTKRVALTALPYNATITQQQEERTTVQQKLNAIVDGIQAHRDLESAAAQTQTWAQAHDRLEQRYAAYTGMSTAMEATTHRLEAARRRTTPTEDLSTERRWLLNGDYSAPDVRFFQIALILLVLSMGSYFVAPTPVAHVITTGLLCIGAAAGFFLKG